MTVDENLLGDSTSALYARILARRDSLLAHARGYRMAPGGRRSPTRENHAQLTLYAMQVQSVERWMARNTGRVVPPGDQ